VKRAGIVLCGGRSQRMGRPKALLPWFGRSLIEHVVERLAPCVDEVLVVRSSGLELPASLAARVVVDREPERGPLAALRDGLAAARAELAFVTSVDAPFLSPGHIAALFAEAEGHGRATAARADGFLQVLSAVYPCAAWREADALLIEGIASPTAFLERLGFVVLETDPADGIAPWTGFNTPAEYLALARRQDPRAAAVVEWRLGESNGSGARTGEAIRRMVAIGLLGEVLRAAAPVGTSLDGARAAGRLSVSFSEGELARDFDLGLPVGPGELVAVREGAGAPSTLRGGAR
jgi:molybdenum cofactor guanylyltransferase